MSRSSPAEAGRHDRQVAVPEFGPETQRLLVAAEEAKRELSDNPQTVVELAEVALTGSGPLDLAFAITRPEFSALAQEVIQRSLATTQQIACLLGENAAESEITLNSIIESFSPTKPEEPKADHDWRKLYRH